MNVVFFKGGDFSKATGAIEQMGGKLVSVSVSSGWWDTARIWVGADRLREISALPD
jgi:hypothetical protein